MAQTISVKGYYANNRSVCVVAKNESHKKNMDSKTIKKFFDDMREKIKTNTERFSCIRVWVTLHNGTTVEFSTVNEAITMVRHDPFKSRF